MVCSEKGVNFAAFQNHFQVISQHCWYTNMGYHYDGTWVHGHAVSLFFICFHHSSEHIIFDCNKDEHKKYQF